MAASASISAPPSRRWPAPYAEPFEVTTCAQYRSHHGSAGLSIRDAAPSHRQLCVAGTESTGGGRVSAGAADSVGVLREQVVICRLSSPASAVIVAPWQGKFFVGPHDLKHGPERGLIGSDHRFANCVLPVRYDGQCWKNFRREQQRAQFRADRSARWRHRARRCSRVGWTTESVPEKL